MDVDTDITREERLELLQHTAKQVDDAQNELNNAELRRRIEAAVSVRAGVPKTAVANTLHVSRPTLDAWLGMVESTPDEMAEVEDYERRERHWRNKYGR